ncbi:MAG: hypothetical protein AB7K71_18190 [Polyangiaceae bacterium]
MKSRTCAAATDRTNRRSSAQLISLFAMLALVGTAGCAMEAQPEEEGVTQSSALVEDEGESVDEAEFEQSEATASEAESAAGTVSDDPTPVPWHEDEAEQVGNATDPTPQPWDVHVLNTRYSAQSHQTK